LGVVVAYTYNSANDRATMTLPGSRAFTYGYDATSGRLTSISDWQSLAIGFAYDADGNRTGITRPNGVDSTYTYDLADRLTAIDHHDSGGTIMSFDYTLDAAGNRTTVVSNAGTESYTLDALNRITGVDYPTGDDVSYTYDNNGQHRHDDCGPDDHHLHLRRRRRDDLRRHEHVHLR
jgi:YD repeat-containing protein